MKYAMLMGNPADGFVVVGPFEDRDVAMAYLESETSSENMWIVDMHEPDPMFMAEYARETAKPA